MEFKRRHSGKDFNIFTEITALAKQYNAVNLSQGSPDYDLHPELKKFIIEATEYNVNQYASVSVFPMLAESIIRFNGRRNNPINITENQLTVIPGATYGMYVAFATFLEKDDEVLVLEPFYETYTPSFEIRNAKPIYIKSNENFEINWLAIKNAITPRTKAIIVNSPNNPTGEIWKKQDWDTLWEIIKDTEIIVVSDEVYDLICYDHHQFYSAFHHNEIKNRCFCIYSFEKMFHISGWKAGYIIAPEKYTQAFQRIHQYLSFNINAYSQYALAKFLDIFDIEKNKMIFQNKRDYFCKIIENSPFEIIKKAESGYFQTVSFRNYDQTMPDKDFALKLLIENQIAGIPYSEFYSGSSKTGFMRFCFAKDDATLDLAAAFFAKIVH